jgi:hypothetical protein
MVVSGHATIEVFARANSHKNYSFYPVVFFLLESHDADSFED